jgi:signal transduction histidine kinase
MISTHWHEKHQPSEQQLRFLDVLARQAADVIERRQAEAALLESRECTLKLNRELEEADRNKNEFLSALSHELRNPLAAISVGLQLVDTARDMGEKDYALEIMKRQMNQLCRLVDDLMDLTRIKCNKIQLKKEMVELNKLAMLTGEDTRQLFERKGSV